VKLLQAETVELGFIVNAKKRRTMETMIGYFEHLSEQQRVRIVCFPLENVDLEELVVEGIVVAGSRKWQECVKLPSFLYNFALHSTANDIDKMRTLRKTENITVINPINRFNQSIIFEMLASLNSLQPYLLPSAPFTESTLNEFIDKYDSLFLLPDKTFRPPKAVTVQKTGTDRFMIRIGRRGFMCRKDELLSVLLKMTDNQKYVLMKGIERVGEWERCEATVFLQKDATGEWSVAKMATNQGMFSNSPSCDESVNRLPDDAFGLCLMKQTLADVSLRIGKFLDFHIPFLGSCTLDYIFEENRPRLVYFSGFELRRLDSETQQNVIRAAFQYLLSLKTNCEEEMSALYDLDQSVQR